MAQYRYLHLDVFTDRPFEGNQLAVFPDGAPLDARTMQAIAREMAFSETTFVLGAEQPGTDVRMRIFTPAEELPMAGHPVIGSTFALAHLGVIPPNAAGFVFGLGVGPTPVALQWAGASLTFAWMTQQRPAFGAVVNDRAAVAAAINIEATDVADTPPQVISCGIPYLIVPLRTRAAVDRAVPDTRAVERFWRTVRLPVTPIFFFSMEPGADKATAYSRMFAPGFGILEDPATGSASGPLGCYLLRNGLVTPAQARSIVSAQGVVMGRPSRIHVSIESQETEITAVRVGGTAVLLGDGTLQL